MKRQISFFIFLLSSFALLDTANAQWRIDGQKKITLSRPTVADLLVGGEKNEKISVIADDGLPPRGVYFIHDNYDVGGYSITNMSGGGGSFGTVQIHSSACEDSFSFRGKGSFFSSLALSDIPFQVDSALGCVLNHVGADGQLISPSASVINMYALPHSGRALHVRADIIRASVFNMFSYASHQSSLNLRQCIGSVYSGYVSENAGVSAQNITNMFGCVAAIHDGNGGTNNILNAAGMLISGDDLDVQHSYGGVAGKNIKTLENEAFHANKFIATTDGTSTPSNTFQFGTDSWIFVSGTNLMFRNSAGNIGTINITY